MAVLVVVVSTHVVLPKHGGNEVVVGRVGDVVVGDSVLDTIAMSAQFLYCSCWPQPISPQPLLFQLVFHHIWRTQYWHEMPTGRRTLRLTVVVRLTVTM